MSFLRSITAVFRGALRGKTSHPLAALINLSEFQRAIGYTITRHDLFHEALSHRSYLKSAGGEGLVSNERLEFLGDSVLNLLVAEYLFASRSDAPEGELTKVRARLVNRKALALYAKDIGLERFLLTSSQTDSLSGRGLETILSDAFEAVIGAIYLDGGFEAARRFVKRTAIETFHSGDVGAEDDNYKSMLLEHAQAEGMGVPRYSTIGERGPDHDRTFTVSVQIGGSKYGSGSGKNKKDAEQDAARDALRSLGILD